MFEVESQFKRLIMQVKLKDIAQVPCEFWLGFGRVDRQKKYKERDVVHV